MSAFEARPPYGSYAAIMGAFAGLLATAGALGRLLDRDPQCQTALDFGVLGRLLTWSLGAAAANDFLQAGFAALAGKANELGD